MPGNREQRCTARWEFTGDRSQQTLREDPRDDAHANMTERNRDTKIEPALRRRVDRSQRHVGNDAWRGVARPDLQTTALRNFNGQ